MTTTESREPLSGSVEFTVGGAYPAALADWIRTRSLSHAYVILAPPDRPEAGYRREAESIYLERFEALEPAVQAEVGGYPVGAVVRWLLESDLDSLPADLRDWLKAEWVFEVRVLGPALCGVYAHFRESFRQFDGFLNDVLRQFGVNEGSATYTTIRPADPNSDVRRITSLEELGPRPGPIQRLQSKRHETPAAAPSTDRPDRAADGEASATPGKPPPRWLKKTRAELHASGWHITPGRYARCLEEAELHFGECAMTLAEIADHAGFEYTTVKQDFYLMRKHGALDRVTEM